MLDLRPHALGYFGMCMAGEEEESVHAWDWDWRRAICLAAYEAVKQSEGVGGEGTE